MGASSRASLKLSDAISKFEKSTAELTGEQKLLAEATASALADFKTAITDLARQLD